MKIAEAFAEKAPGLLNGIPSREYAYHYGSYYYARGRYEESAKEDQAV